MGKNTHGGAGHKKFARKHNAPTNIKASSHIRTSEDPNEVYAIATKMLGNNMLECYCIDNKPRLCHIRGRFAGRSKRDNIVNVGTWILIGLREWEVNSSNSISVNKKNKLEQCDLLEIYSGIAKERLKEIVDENWHILNSHDLSKVDTNLSKPNENGGESDDELKFITERDEEIMRLTEEMKSNTSKKITFKNTTINENNDEDTLITYDENGEINVDDI